MLHLSFGETRCAAPSSKVILEAFLPNERRGGPVNPGINLCPAASGEVRKARWGV